LVDGRRSDQCQGKRDPIGAAVIETSESSVQTCAPEESDILQVDDQWLDGVSRCPIHSRSWVRAEVIDDGHIDFTLNAHDNSFIAKLVVDHQLHRRWSLGRPVYVWCRAQARSSARANKRNDGQVNLRAHMLDNQLGDFFSVDN
jgi:hypothetical protein